MNSTYSHLNSPATRFIVVGGANTLATGILLAALSYVFPGWLAYTIAFAAGITFSSLVTGRFVFSAPLSMKTTLLYASAYLVIFAVGQLVIAGFALTTLPAAFNGLVVVVTAPLSFLAGRAIFAADQQRVRRRAID